MVNPKLSERIGGDRKLSEGIGKLEGERLERDGIEREAEKRGRQRGDEREAEKAIEKEAEREAERR